MYDMYPWDEHAAMDAGHAGRARVRARAAHAVQVALDRRDNGGDAAPAEAGAAAVPARPSARPARQ